MRLMFAIFTLLEAAAEFKPLILELCIKLSNSAQNDKLSKCGGTTTTILPFLVLVFKYKTSQLDLRAEISSFSVLWLGPEL
jgi:hypothetical protein